MKRDDIIDAIVVRMETIRIGNGYLTDAGKNVERDRVAEMDPTEDYLIDVTAGAWETEDTAPGAVRRWMNVTVAFACRGTDAIDIRDNLLTDVVQATYTDLTWGGLAILSEETGGAADKDYADDLYAWGELDMRVLYDTVEGEI